MFIKSRVQTYHKHWHTFYLLSFFCLYLHKLQIKIIPSCYPLMKTELFPDKNPTQRKGAYMAGDQSFSSQRYISGIESL